MLDGEVARELVAGRWLDGRRDLVVEASSSKSLMDTLSGIEETPARGLTDAELNGVLSRVLPPPRSQALVIRSLVGTIGLFLLWSSVGLCTALASSLDLIVLTTVGLCYVAALHLPEIRAARRRRWAIAFALIGALVAVSYASPGVQDCVRHYVRARELTHTHDWRFCFRVALCSSIYSLITFVAGPLAEWTVTTFRHGGAIFPEGATLRRTRWRAALAFGGVCLALGAALAGTIGCLQQAGAY